MVRPGPQECEGHVWGEPTHAHRRANQHEIHPRAGMEDVEFRIGEHHKASGASILILLVNGYDNIALRQELGLMP